MKAVIRRIFLLMIVVSLAACTPAPGPAIQTVAPGASALPETGASPTAAVRIPTNTPTRAVRIPTNTPTQAARLPANTPTTAAGATPLAEASATPPAPPTAAGPQPTFAPELERAVAALRHLDAGQPAEDQVARLEQADKTIKQAGPEGARRLKQELAALQQSGEKDVVFQLDAAWLLWEIGGLTEVDAIVDIWASIPSQEWNYKSLFMPAMQAAATQDPRALPMLQALAAEREGSAYFSQNDLSLRFPRTHEFLWGAYGSKGLPVLHETLQRSTNLAELESAIYVLASAQYLPALPDIRFEVDNPDAGVRHAAIYALGQFGHPDDYETLIAGLTAVDGDPDDVLTYVFALNEFGDVRAAPHLIPLLQSDDQDLRMEVTWGLADYLATPEGLAALREAAANTTDPQWREFYQYAVQQTLGSAGTTWSDFQGMPEAEQRQVLEAYHAAARTLKPGEQALTRDQLLEMTAEWRETGQLDAEKWGWVAVRHILPVVTADDIDLLLDGKAGFYLRFSKQAIEEAAMVEEWIQWIGRSRYR